MMRWVRFGVVAFVVVHVVKLILAILIWRWLW